MDHVGGDNVLRVGGGVCTRFGETESSTTINTMQFENNLLCPYYVPGAVLEVNRINPDLVPRSHSLHLHFTCKLVGHMRKGRDPQYYLSCPFQSVSPHTTQKERDDVYNMLNLGMVLS